MLTFARLAVDLNSRWVCLTNGRSDCERSFRNKDHEVPTGLQGKLVSEIEASFPGYRVFVERLRRNGGVRKPSADEQLRAGDQVALWGRREALIGANSVQLGKELYDPALLNIDVAPHESRVVAIKCLNPVDGV